MSGMETATCATPLSLPGCDPILFLGIGHRKAGTERWDLLDDQLTPIRGFGAHAGAMSAVGERLTAGDELALLVYGFHAQYPVTWSRDLLVPATNFAGTINLPLRSPDEYPRQRHYFRHYVPAVLRHSRVVIASSESTRRDLMEFYGLQPDKLRVVLLGYDTTRFTPSPPPGPGPPTPPGRRRPGGSIWSRPKTVQHG